MNRLMPNNCIAIENDKVEVPIETKIIDSLCSVEFGKRSVNQRISSTNVGINHVIKKSTLVGSLIILKQN